ncbi:ubiquitin carboxyl-terminal hydrolase 16/45 [Mytilus galloprovincialis]|uniref:ubiquitinyl hydrolase 1 n=1 Tax=Mytilus galloprovincialis TaxID=29158 RepID=A0A8B6CVP4_MYTGA|nr:ubiquitin carboxyl-terminal hydrolase 16/45 [Mytilus galloprovincialis]
MRVQATETTPTYSMGKNKKHKIRKTKEASDSSDDGSVPTCNHVNMSVNFAQMKKGLGKQTFGECLSCNKDSASSKRGDKSCDGMAASAMTTEDSLLGEMEPTMWVCLHCGHQGCDRNSHEKHALKHYETPRSSSHCIVINTSTWSTWCYKCDDGVPVEKNKKIQECLDHLRKQSGLPLIESGSAKRTSSFGASGSSSVEQVKETSNRPLTPRGPTPGVCHKLKGLSNLGNTCFFNAVMQNLTQTQSLESLVQERSKKGKSVNIDSKQLSDTEDSNDEDEERKGDITALKELPPMEIVLPEAGPLTQSMVHFLQEMNNNSNRNSTVNPSALFSQICKKAQRFRGFQQQDSHELLRYLLDSMKMEEIKRSQAAILKHYRLPENINPKKVPEDIKVKIKEYGRLVKHTFVDTMFGGHLLSTVMCEECKHISQIFEPFLDLSLPVTEEKTQRPNQALGARRKESEEKIDESVKTDGGKQYKATRQSKQEMKKQKRLAKKDARKKSKASLTKSTQESTGQEVEGEVDQDNEPEGVDDEEEEDEDKKSEGQKSGEQDDNSSNKDDPSDADIEDNLESDISRVLSMDTSVNLSAEDVGSTNSTTSVSENTMNSSTSTVQDTTDSTLSSSTSTIQADSSVTDVLNTDSNNTLNNVSDSVLLNDVEDNKIEDGKELSKPKVIANATLDDVHIDVVNGYCNNFHDDEVFETLNSLDNANTLCNDMDAETKSDCHGVMRGKGEKLDNSMENTINGMVINSANENKVEKNVEDMSTKLESLSVNGALDTQELTSKLESLDINCSQQRDKSNHIHFNGLDVNSDDENTSKHDKNIDDESCQKSSRNSKNSPPLSRQGSAKNTCNKRDFKKEAQVKSTTMLGTHYIPSSRECSVMSCLHQFTSAELLTGNNKFGCANCTKLRDKKHSDGEKKGMVYSNASKYYLIYTPPPVLTLHLKRFEQVGFTSRKVNRHVDFPFILDISPFCSSMCQGVKPGQKKILYSLYGVVEHSGRLNAGHYTAYVKVRPNIGMISNYYNHSGPSFNDYIQRYTEHLVNNGPKENVEDIDEVQEEKLVPPGRWYHISDSRVSEATESTVQRAQAYLLFYERIY